MLDARAPDVARMRTRAEHRTLVRWLDAHPERDQFDLPGIAGWIALSTRFRFTDPPDPC